MAGIERALAEERADALGRAGTRLEDAIAAVVQDARPRTLIALAASSFDSPDSTLFAWASSAESPIEAVGFSVYPTRLGARTIDASLRAADRWMLAAQSSKPHWVFGAGGYPLAHGEVSQERVIWGALAWATEHPRINGLVVMEANDYGRAMGLRAPDGRFRQAAQSVTRAVRALRESAARPAEAEGARLAGQLCDIWKGSVTVMALMFTGPLPVFCSVSTVQPALTASGPMNA